MLTFTAKGPQATSVCSELLRQKLLLPNATPRKTFRWLHIARRFLAPGIQCQRSLFQEGLFGRFEERAEISETLFQTSDEQNKYKAIQNGPLLSRLLGPWFSSTCKHPFHEH